MRYAGTIDQHYGSESSMTQYGQEAEAVIVPLIKIVDRLIDRRRHKRDSRQQEIEDLDGELVVKRLHESTWKRGVGD